MKEINIRNKLYRFDIRIGYRKNVITQILVGQMYFETGYTIINMKYLLTTVARNGDDSFILVAFTMPYF